MPGLGSVGNKEWNRWCRTHICILTYRGCCHFLLCDQHRITTKLKFRASTDPRQNDDVVGEVQQSSCCCCLSRRRTSKSSSSLLFHAGCPFTNTSRPPSFHERNLAVGHILSSLAFGRIFCCFCFSLFFFAFLNYSRHVLDNNYYNYIDDDANK